MRIAMVSEHASPLTPPGGPDAGGQNIYVARLSRVLAERGHSVTVYTRRDAPSLPDRVEAGPGLTVEHVPSGPPRQLPKDRLPPYMPAFGEYLAHRWAGDRPDVVHAHFWMSGMAALAAARPLAVPVVQTYHALGTVKRRHQGAADTSPPERVAVERRIGLACGRIIATCADEVDELTAMGVPPDRASVVPCGVDTEVFRPPRARTRRRPGHRHRLLAVGRLVPRKGFADVIRALPALPDTELLIAGGPAGAGLATDPEAGRLRDLADDLGVGERLRLLGAVPHAAMPELFGSADVVVAAPEYEPFGIVPLEAMSCGVPVVATAVGGQLDSVADGVTGALVPPRDPAALAAATGRLLADARLRRRYGVAGRARAVERFSWPRVADGTEDVYRRLVAPHPLTTGVLR